MTSPPSPSESLPYASSYHVPIMVAEVLELLDVRPGGVYLDGTLGGGGHSAAILERSAPDGRVIALDRDAEAIRVASERLAPYGERFQAVRSNYAKMGEALAALDLARVDGVLIDAGVSSHQLDLPERGFSFRAAGPLDMRMGQGDGAPTLLALLEAITVEELAEIIKEFGELRGAYRVARGILQALHDGALHTTLDLHRVITAQIRPAQLRAMNVSPSTLVFQALRIAVNDELAHLSAALKEAVAAARPGGRVAFISFHSLEDRIIKRGLKRLADPCVCPPGLPVCACHKTPEVKILTPKPRRPSARECALNPRARSASLRAACAL